jgi:carboxypeptidase Taq
VIAYQSLEQRFARLSDIEDAIGLLSWDAAVMMPAGGAPGRADQLASLKAVAHEILTAPDIGELLAKAESEKLDPWRAANLAEMKRQWKHASAVPQALVEALSRASSVCEMAWREAKPKNDFAAVAPLLDEVIKLTRETAQAKGQALKLSPHDALLDQYEPGLTLKTVDALFADLEQFLPGLLAQAVAARGSRPELFHRPVAEHRQRTLGLTVMRLLGFDFDHGRLDVSAHPFCGGTPLDVRITTRYDEEDPLRSLMSVLHETGHALYDLGLPLSWRRQPVGKARGMAAHESQSLIIEMQAARSWEFLGFLAPMIDQALGVKLDPEALYRSVTWVEPSFIRVDADEVTYPLHVILRHRLEKAILAGRMNAKDIPAAWNFESKRLLGVEPKSDREGCLQDIHWYDGTFGYFPTYTFGAMLAAQLFAAAERAYPDLRRSLGKGDFSPLIAWLRVHIHQEGSLLSNEKLIEKATGQPPTASFLKAHLQRRYVECS